MSVDRERLRHDVGKYIARVATNVPPGSPVPPALAPLLLRDVYGRADEPSMRLRFRELTPGADDPVLTACRRELDALASLESPARAGDAETLTEVADRARRVARMLREWTP
ncbi:MAG: hypothetical protein CMN30_04480 [Sandaracinus sp.]|nr:hypothetical protein [Sandaracinus sp.]|tara:strand:- start:1341 stop:1673 length:333 start_codon:yes stop_codon:yes gene_type:complete